MYVTCTGNVAVLMITVLILFDELIRNSLFACVLTHVHTFIRVHTHLHKCKHKPACREHMHAYIILVLLSNLRRAISHCIKQYMVIVE